MPLLLAVAAIAAALCCAKGRFESGVGGFVRCRVMGVGVDVGVGGFDLCVCARALSVRVDLHVYIFIYINTYTWYSGHYSPANML